MFFLVYNIISVFLVLPVLAYHYYRSASRGRPAAFRERFGLIPQAELDNLGNRPVIWLHAVSVGEAIASRPLLKALRSRYPDHAIVISNTTETGRAIASSFPEKDLCIYFPFDFLPAVRHALNAIRPRIVIIMETEIWPNFTREVHRRGIPMVLANGRISDNSFKGYMRFKWFFNHALKLFSQLCMQTASDRDRIISIGAPAEHTVVAGNLKYDIPFRQVGADERRELRNRFAIPQTANVLVAGSTHRGEEQYLLDSYLELLPSHPELLLVLAPRHPERAGEVAALLEQSGLTFRLRSQLASQPEEFSCGQVLLVDTVGELMQFYALSDLVFMGGSLVPTGGHNLLEPASVGVPSVFGPHMTNFREITALVLSFEAGIQIPSPSDLTAACQTLLTDSQQRHNAGQNGLRMLAETGGATSRHMEIIARYL